MSLLQITALNDITGYKDNSSTWREAIRAYEMRMAFHKSVKLFRVVCLVEFSLCNYKNHSNPVFLHVAIFGKVTFSDLICLF